MEVEGWLVVYTLKGRVAHDDVGHLRLLLLFVFSWVYNVYICLRPCIHSR